MNNAGYLVITESFWEDPQEYYAETYAAAEEIADHLRNQQYRVKIKPLTTNHLDDRW